MNRPTRTRIAPSPTGDPHVGTAYTGLFNWLLARKTGGQFLLRIEDTDRSRSTPESEQAILRSLSWLGLDWDEGPDVEGPHGPYRQSERTERYREAASQLVENGAAYPCFCTPDQLEEMRERQKAAKSAFGYEGPCRDADPAESRRRIDAGEAHAIRLRIDKSGKTVVSDFLRGDVEFDNKEVDDQILLKSDGFPTYHLANVVDDHHMEITHVLRAEEWITSTPKHVMLYEAFGWELPVFCHLPLLRNADKNKTKISKRKNPTSLDYYRDKGYLPEAMLNFLALMGFSPGEGDGDEVYDLEELKERFDPGRISLGGPVFDLTKLDWINGAWIRRLEADDLVARLIAAHPDDYPADAAFLHQVLPLVRERLKTLLDLDPWVSFFFVDEVELTRDAFRRTKLDAEQMARVLDLASEVLDAEEDIVAERDEPRLKDAAIENKIKIGGWFMTLRVAFSGTSTTPPLVECMQILGKDRTLARLRAAARFLREGQPSEL